MYELYYKAIKHCENDEYELALINFLKVKDLLLEKEMSEEVLSLMLFASGDNLNVTFNIPELYHNIGVSLFYLNNDKAINNFTKAIEIDENHENSYYMRAAAYLTLLDDWQSSLNDINIYLTYCPDDNAGKNLFSKLEKIKKMGDEINKLYNKAQENYEKGFNLKFNANSNYDEDDEDEYSYQDTNEEVKNLISLSLNIIELTIKRFTHTKNPNLFLKSHNFSFSDILFKKLQCFILIGESPEKTFKAIQDIVDSSEELFMPSKPGFTARECDTFGSNTYLKLCEDIISEYHNKITKRYEEINNEKILKVNENDLMKIGDVLYYKNKPFTGIALNNDEGWLMVEYEVVYGISHGFCKHYSFDGDLKCEVKNTFGSMDKENKDKYFKYLFDSL